MTEKYIRDFYKSRDEFYNSMYKRCEEIEAICDKYDFDAGISSFESFIIELDSEEEYVYFSYSWHCLGEEGTDYSHKFPLSCLWSDDDLIAFIKKEKEKLDKKAKEKADRIKNEEYKKYLELKEKFE